MNAKIKKSACSVDNVLRLCLCCGSRTRDMLLKINDVLCLSHKRHVNHVTTKCKSTLHTHTDKLQLSINPAITINMLHIYDIIRRVNYLPQVSQVPCPLDKIPRAMPMSFLGVNFSSTFPSHGNSRWLPETGSTCDITKVVHI